jgi:hypothetical protein
MIKKCISVLTRGYNKLIEYDNLIKRNIHIQNNLIDKDIDILIFHEGNITLEHQTYIIEKTLQLKIKFINVKKDNYAFKKEKEIISIDQQTREFNMGYRHMCSFWFVDFWYFVKDYNYLLRIDEDCYINFNIDNCFIILDSYFFMSSLTTDDHDFVTKGLNDFTLEFLKNNTNNTYNKKRPSGPYTNIFGINLTNIRDNEILNKYIKEVDNSGKIYSQRWGDLPLWGEAIHYILGDEKLKIERIKYYHGSHKRNINENIQENIQGNIQENILNNILRNIKRNIQGNIRENIQENIINNILKKHSKKY